MHVITVSAMLFDTSLMIVDLVVKTWIGDETWDDVIEIAFGSVKIRFIGSTEYIRFALSF